MISKQAISMIHKYFFWNKVQNLLPSTFYSILYYNADMWLFPSLKPQLLQQLLSASASALKTSTGNCDYVVSFDKIHSINKPATPKHVMEFKHWHLLFEIYDNTMYSKEWIALNFKQSFYAQNPFYSFNWHQNMSKYW